jgi:hypothetical protein
MNLRDNIIKHDGVSYRLCFTYPDYVLGNCNFLERHFPNEKKRNEVRGKMIEQLVKSGRLERIEPKKIELVEGGLFYMEDGGKE